MNSANYDHMINDKRPADSYASLKGAAVPGFFSVKETDREELKKAVRSAAGNTYSVNLGSSSIVPGTGAFDKNGLIDGVSGKKNAAALLNDPLAKDKASVMKDKMILLSNTMSDEGYKKAAEDGFDLAAIDPDEAVTIGDEIRATMARAGVVINGFNDDISTEKLARITGSPAMAESIKKSFDAAGLPLTAENAAGMKEMLDMAEGIKALSEDTKLYIAANSLEPTVENIYYAGHSTGMTKAYGKETADLPEAIMEQLKKVIEEAGFVSDDSNTAAAAALVKADIPVTAESFAAYKELEKIDFPLDTDKLIEAGTKAVADGKPAYEADLTGRPSLLERAVSAKETIEKADDATIGKLISEDKEISIENLKAAENAADKGAYEVTDTNVNLVKARRIMEETRLHMSVQVNFSLLKQGISIETEPLSDLVEKLKSAESEINRIRFDAEETAEADTRAELYKESLDTVESLKNMPAAVFGSYVQISIQTVSINELSVQGETLRRQYEAAGQAYETMRTEVRTDLGDSLSKAFANAGDLLDEIGIEKTDPNLRAVRILGYNSMEINESSVNSVKAAYSYVDGIINRMTPAATLSLIRSGDNPLKMSMDELDKRLAAEDTSNSPEKYSEYLVRMQEKGLISDEESESFIGIYRLLHQAASNDGAAVGMLMKSGAEINFANILTAVRSRRDTGLDVTVDDLYDGMTSKVSSDISLQIETAYTQVRAESNMESIRDAVHIPTEIYEELIESEVIATADHARGLDALRKNRGGLFKTGEKSASLLAADNADAGDIVGAAIEDMIRSSYARVIDEFNDRDSAGAAYSEMTSLMESVFESAAFKDGERIDVREYSLAMKQLHVAGDLAREESYEVPMEIGGEMSSVSIRIRHEGRGEASAEINMETVGFGNVRGRLEAVQGSVKAMILTGSRELKSEENRVLGLLSEAMHAEGVSFGGADIIYSEKMSVNISHRNADVDSNSDDTAALYRASKVFIKVFGGTL